MLVRNFAAVMASQVGTWLITMVSTIAIPRFLGAELIGQFHLANSIWALGFVITGFGMNLALTKAVARDYSRIGELLGNSIAVRLLISVPVTIGLYVYALAVDYSDQLLILLAIVGLGMIFATITASITAVLQGLDRMGAMSASNVIGRLVAVAGAVVLLLAGFSIFAVAALATVGNLVTLVIQARALRSIRTEMGGTGTGAISLARMADLLKESVPYFWITLFIAIYLQIDTIVISLLVDRDEVLGYYSVYDRLSSMLLFVPTVFMTAVYPTLARLYEGAGDANTNRADDERDPLDPGQDSSETWGAEDLGLHHRLTRKSFELLLLISVPAGLGIAVVARPLIVLLFGDDFADAAPVIAVGGIVISLTYLTTVLGMFLISMDRQRQWTRFIALGAFLTIPLDILLVPYFEDRYANGAIGGAVAYLITETIILSGAIYLLPRGSLGPSSLLYAVRVLTAGLVMVVATLAVREQHLLVSVLVGAVAYSLMTMALRLIAPEDRRLLAATVLGPLNRRRGSEA